jgi:hypothetical protein
VKTWVVRSGQVAAASFAAGAPIVGIALCGGLGGAVLLGFAGDLLAMRAPFAASVGRPLEQWRRAPLVSRSSDASRRLLSQAAPRFGTGCADRRSARGVVDAGQHASQVCRPPQLGSLCHHDLIAVLIVVNALFLARLLVVSARRCVRGQTPGREDQGEAGSE